VTPPERNKRKKLPFVLRVATEWLSLEEVPQEGDGVVFFQQRALLTSEFLTRSGDDVRFSDLGVRE
jgi:hypothetical protein